MRGMARRLVTLAIAAGGLAALSAAPSPFTFSASLDGIRAWMERASHTPEPLVGEVRLSDECVCEEPETEAGFSSDDGGGG
jgi:hypothetical protein